MEYFLKASAVIALFYLCFYIFLKKETFFQHNRWFLLIGLLLALVFPFIVIPVDIPIEPIVITETAYIQTIPSNYVVTQPETTFNWSTLVPIIYVLGFAIFLIQFVLQFGSLVSILLKNPKYKDELFTYVIVKNKISPFSFFKLIVYNPDAFEVKELVLILTHEKVHAKQLHSIDILFAQLACVIFWFNPLIWLYRKEVRQNLEYIADFKTQIKSNSQKEYQRLLLKTSVANHNISLSNKFYNSLIKERIVMLKKSRSNRKKQWRYLLMLPLLAGLLMSMNTEKVYIETESTAVKNDGTIEFVVTKNTTDTELKAMSTAVENKGVQTAQIEKQNPSNFSHIEIVFTKETTDKQLDEIKKELKSNDITMTIKRLKRNKKSEISDIHIDFKTKNGSANYKVKDKEGIQPFFFKMGENGSFGVGAINNDVHVIETIHESRPEKSHSKSKSNVFIYEIDNDSLETIVEDSTNDKYLNKHYEKVINKLHRANEHRIDSIIIENSHDSENPFFIRNSDSISVRNGFSIDSAEVIRLSKVKTDYFHEGNNKRKVISSDENIIFFNLENAPKTKSIYSGKPLIIIDGKVERNDAMNIIKPNDIEHINVLKGESATEIYGVQGENGVIVITTKSKNTWTTKSDTKEKNPWSISLSSSYIDEDDTSKNGTLVYISKRSADHILEAQKTIIEKQGIKVKYSKVRRNKAGEITSIKISLKNENGNESSASYKNDDGISPIEFGISESALVVRTSTMPMD